MSYKNESEYFNPFLWALVERDAPSPIFAVAYTGVKHWLYTSLDMELSDFCFDAQVEIVGQEVRAKQRELPNTPFGRTLGYLFVRRPGDIHEFKIDGYYVGLYEKLIPHLTPSLRLDLR